MSAEELWHQALEPEAHRRWKEEEKAWFEREGKPLLVKAFKRVDTQDTGVLEKEDAADFFAQLVHKQVGMTKILMPLAIDLLLKVWYVEKFVEIARDTKEEIVLKARAEAQRMEDSYLRDKAVRDAAAFKVLDANGDGSIALADFLAVFEPEPGSETGVNFYIALLGLTQDYADKSRRYNRMFGRMCGTVRKMRSCVQAPTRVCATLW